MVRVDELFSERTKLILEIELAHNTVVSIMGQTGQACASIALKRVNPHLLAGAFKVPISRIQFIGETTCPNLRHTALDVARVSTKFFYVRDKTRRVCLPR